VINWTGLQFAGARNGIALMNGGWLNPAQVKLVHDATLAACDSSDGVLDRVVADPVGCIKAFDPAKLQCKPGQAADTCLNDAQIKAIKTLRTPFKFPYALANGVTEYPGWGIGGEDTTAFGPTGGWRAWWTGSAAPTVPAQASNGIAWTYGSGALQYFYARDPKADPRTITPESVAARVREVSALMDSTNPDLRAFQQRGGKLIVLEHMSDYAQSAFAGIQYLDAVARTIGPRQPPEFIRLYTAPGVDHVGTGAPALVDVLGVLATWTEKGHFPYDLESVEQEAKPPFKVLRSRPLCQWPRWPKFTGGDADKSANFACFY
jgi:Tannase and feruloyl esterase